MTKRTGDQGREDSGTSHHAAAWLAWALLALWVALLAAAVFLILLNGPGNGSATQTTDPWGTANMVFIYPVVFVAFALVGALISSRRPENAIGWVCLTIGLIMMLSGTVDEYGVYALETRPRALPGGAYAAWLGSWLWIPAVFLIGTFLVLIFPDGRLPSRHWRVVAWLSGAALVSASVSEAFSPGRMAEAQANVTNPLGIESARNALEVLGAGGIALLPVCCVASALSMLLRYRRSVGEERQQIKWFATAAVLLGACFPFVFVVPWGIAEDLVTLLFAGLPIAIGVAVLRYRLYDIDILVNRALVYGPLTAMLVASYVGGVVSLQAALRVLTGQESTLAVVASTLVIAALFNPLRRRVQGFIDRRFYRRKYDAAKTLEAFGSRLRDETDLDALSSDVVGVARRTVQPAHVSLWLRPDPEPEVRSGAFRRFGHE